VSHAQEVMGTNREPAKSDTLHLGLRYTTVVQTVTTILFQHLCNLLCFFGAILVNSLHVLA